jgi:hypothetical protein
MAMVVACFVVVVTADAIKPATVSDYGLTEKNGQHSNDDRDREKQKDSSVVHSSTRRAKTNMIEAGAQMETMGVGFLWVG